MCFDEVRWGITRMHRLSIGESLAAAEAAAGGEKPVRPGRQAGRES